MYTFIKKYFSWLIRLIVRMEVVGEENFPKEGGFLLCANHTSMADVVPLAFYCPKQVNFMAKSEVLKVPLIGRFLRGLGAFPVKRGAADVGALKYAIKLLKEGKVVGYFPQGTRRPGVDPRETEAKGGIGMMALHSGCGAVPVYLQTKGDKLKLFHKVKVIVGKPIPFEELPFETKTSDEYAKVSRYIFDRICDMRDEALKAETNK